MDFWPFVGVMIALGIPVVGLSLLMTLRVFREIQRQRETALAFEAKLAAYRHAVDRAGGAATP